MSKHIALAILLSLTACRPHTADRAETVVVAAEAKASRSALAGLAATVRKNGGEMEQLAKTVGRLAYEGAADQSCPTRWAAQLAKLAAGGLMPEAIEEGFTRQMAQGATGGMALGATTMTASVRSR